MLVVLLETHLCLCDKMWFSVEVAPSHTPIGSAMFGWSFNLSPTDDITVLRTNSFEMMAHAQFDTNGGARAKMHARNARITH